METTKNPVFKNCEVWFVTGSQFLYGEETLNQVAADSQKIVETLNSQGNLSVEVVWKPTIKTPDDVTQLFTEANYSDKCVGLICWMHTFSPAKMWIRGFNLLKKPFLHLHTQFNRDLPWKTIDMDFMNLNQSAHGDREFGFLCTRMKLARKVVAGHYSDYSVQKKIDAWMRAAVGWAEAKKLTVVRFGDNMRQVAVTEGNKVSAEIQFGFEVEAYGVGDLKKFVDQVQDAEIQSLIETYQQEYTVPKMSKHNQKALWESARLECAIRKFLEAKNSKAFVTTFEDLNGLDQLPGLAAQRLMADGFGYGAEGDWKTAAMLRILKVMATGLDGGTSFMEDYTYHLEKGNEKVLEAHMLEVCPSIASKKPSLEVHPLSIGGKADPARLVFNGKSGPGCCASLIDLGDHFRLVVAEIDAIDEDTELPELPVARVIWRLKPNWEIATTAWILAGGAHHSVYSQAVTVEMLEDFAEMTGTEMVVIDDSVRSISQFKKELRLYSR